MIYTVTFNPALDVSGVVESLVPNEKSYLDQEVHTPGGNGINAGRIARRLGAKVMLTGFLGGATGEEIKELLKKEKLAMAFVPIKGRTRMNLTVSNKSDHQQTRLSFPGPEISKTEFQKLQKILSQVNEKDLVIFGGSLPPGITTKMVSDLIKKARMSGACIMVDMPGSILKDVVSSKPHFIKPNLTEFKEMTGLKGDSIEDVLKASQKLLKDIPVICVSSVEGGALLITKDEVWFGKIPPVKIYSTVGAGDSMVGAIARIWHDKKKSSPDILLRSGLAASCATLTEKGLTLGTKVAIKNYLPRIELRKVV